MAGQGEKLPQGYPKSKRSEARAPDVAALLVIMDREWKDLFSTRSRPHLAIVNELIAVRNSWAHQEAFSNDDTDGRSTA
ncbi:MAG: Swt1 family HEPN domain-containing protein [Verrucomicrobiales bacterium]